MLTNKSVAFYHWSTVYYWSLCFTLQNIYYISTSRSCIIWACGRLKTRSWPMTRPKLMLTMLGKTWKWYMHIVKNIIHTLWALVHWWHWLDCMKWQYLFVVIQGPFDVCRKVFSSGEETAHMSLIDKSDLFFHDYSLAPLFVQENYLHVRPAAAGWVLETYSRSGR